MKNTIQIPISRWSFFWSYLIAICLIPAAGLGFFLLWKVENTRASKALIAEEERIRIPDSQELGGVRILDLMVIHDVQIRDTPFPGRWFGVKSLIFLSGSGDIRVDGISNAAKIKETIQLAAYNLRKKRQQPGRKVVQFQSIPGSTDQLNELTLMWQQGLIDDDQFERERTKFS